MNFEKIFPALAVQLNGRFAAIAVGHVFVLARTEAEMKSGLSQVTIPIKPDVGLSDFAYAESRSPQRRCLD